MGIDELAGADLAPRWRPFIDRLHRLYADMDRSYEAVAETYGFVCRGCADNCCRTRFHHHTLLEYLDLNDAWRRLAIGLQRVVKDRVAVRDAGTACPLWQDERCLAYTRRPMICRLHGLPHRLHRPDGTEQTGPGCDAFHAGCGPSVQRLDRTPFYRQMAALEGELRQALDFGGRVRMTVAEMLAAGAAADRKEPAS